jgi:pimeloyl-ACP methyl ester carboxylesterase
MLVLTSGVFVREAPPGAPGAAQLQQLWKNLHRELMVQSSNAQQILVETSGHFIQREQPEVVVSAIQHMLRAVRHKEVGHVD